MRRRSPLASVAVLSVFLVGCTPFSHEAKEHAVSPAPSAPATTEPVSEAPPEDPYTGYFDEIGMDGEGAASQVWGSFGIEGEVQVMTSTDTAVAPGEHRVVFHCAGPRSVTVAAEPFLESGDPVDLSAAPGPGVTRQLVCPGSAAVDITTITDGLTTTVDSHGQPGAFLIQIDPGTSVLAP